MRLTTYNNATVVAEGDRGERLLVDPWVIGNLYLGTWSPSVLHKEEDLSDIRACKNVFISHLHMDHWDLETIRLLEPETRFFLPRLPFIERVIKERLEQMGFSNFVFIAEGDRISVGESLDIGLIGPLNQLGAEVSSYEDETGLYPVAMDSSIVIFDKVSNYAHILLCDNTPYDPRSLERIKSVVGSEFIVGSVFYPFNGAAQDYPVCYDNLTLNEKKLIVESKNNHRNSLIDELCTSLDAKICVPYSSDFMLNGPRAAEFLEVHGESLDREWSVLSMQSINSGRYYKKLLPGSSVEFNKDGDIHTIDGGNVAETTAKHHSLSADFLVDVGTNAKSSQLVVDSLRLCRKRIKKYGFSTRDLAIPLIIYSNEEKRAYVSILNSTNDPLVLRDISPVEVYSRYSEFLAIELPMSLLVRWLENSIHFDNLCISCLLKWHRRVEGDRYPKNLYDALNFFHV